MYSVYCHSFNQVLDVLSTTKTNSSKTSSLPLADFWHPDRNKDLKKELFSCLGIKKDPQLADYCFEYPTPAYKNKKTGSTLQYSKPSMTDLMIIFGEDARITIEAKFTEYKNEEGYSPLLKDWYKKNHPDEEPRHRKSIIQCWIDYIHLNKRCEISTADELLCIDDFPYQFLHRVASACYDCKYPILVYQLFYEKSSIIKMQGFEQILQESARKLILYPEKLPFYIIENEVICCPEYRKGNSSGIFEEMKQKPQYGFGSQTVVDGYSLKQVNNKL